MTESKFDTNYEWKAVTLLGLGFGLVGLDRWLITPLFPAIMADLSLTYKDLGTIVGVLGISWGVFSILMGNVSDRIGRRKVILPAILIFSVLSALSGWTGGFAGLLLIRILMGLAEGSYCPTSVAATGEASHPKRRGLNQGLQMSLFALFGFGFAPIIATQLLQVVPSWRWVFVISALPGIILAAIMYFVIREPRAIPSASVQQPAKRSQARPGWGELFSNRNVLTAIIGLFCAMSGIFVMGAMIPNYLVDYLKLGGQQMGFVMSAIGFGGFLGEFAVPGISDLIGRKLAAILAFIGAAIFLWLFSRTGASPTMLFALLFCSAFFCLGLLALFTGPIAMEAVPAALIASAIGLVSGAGEIFGGGVAPFLAGIVADGYGIQYTLYLALSGLVLGAFVSLFLRETAPGKTAVVAIPAG
ncbi:Predicted arabinose efflux permease, MFS family [Faunimonas pinastri]|uniref:Predicted arabinose efflux permease, MFS family n=1 Tax=Faunimonas pinastri TaxID=1855383 RepID=A0A1H9K5K8_9HYPH|nr:MFS transporter [Faunimonas pinastri]SEQ94424.1 Predicted arabinose efflux permease, MFS family [Faunimonas pinastri]